MKFDIEIPEWARWIAQEPCGWWQAFSNQPQPAAYWAGWSASGYRCKFARGTPPADWTQELYEIEWRAV